MLGFADLWVELAFGLSLLATVACVIYGLINWNKSPRSPRPSTRTIIWEREEKKIDEGL